MRIKLSAPAISGVYEFEISEEKTIGELIAELSDMICEKEHIAVKGDRAQFLMFHKESKSILNSFQSAGSAGIKVGDTLILI